MTEQERVHRERMLKHAEKVRRNMDNLRTTNEGRHKHTYSCPVCSEDVTIQDNSRYAQCSGCQTRLRVDPDATFEGGFWHDLTRLVPI